MRRRHDLAELIEKAKAARIRDEDASLTSGPSLSSFSRNLAARMDRAPSGKVFEELYEQGRKVVAKQEAARRQAMDIKELEATVTRPSQYFPGHEVRPLLLLRMILCVMVCEAVGYEAFDNDGAAGTCPVRLHAPWHEVRI